MSVIGQYLEALDVQAAINAGAFDSVGGVALTIDDIVFQNTEIPEDFGEIGGTQMLAVHDFPGGSRTIQALGAFPATVSWEGWLIGPSAAQRSYQLDRKRVNGVLCVLSFAAQNWSGYVR